MLNVRPCFAPASAAQHSRASRNALSRGIARRTSREKPKLSAVVRRDMGLHTAPSCGNTADSCPTE
jgi:hypothetical protein